MKARLLLGGAILAIVGIGSVTPLSTQPSFNGTTAGCGGGSCHTVQAGILSTSTNNLSVTITLSGAGGNVAGELVNGAGTVVAVNNATSANPFTLIAPSPGTYTVNAGFKKPNLRWDTKSVALGSVAGVRDGQPLRFALEQNFPNPFNPSTTITYEIQDAARVSLDVVDLAGRIVTTLVDAPHVPGRYRVTFQAGSLSSGVYFYRLHAGALSVTRKLIVAR